MSTLSLKQDTLIHDKR